MFGDKKISANHSIEFKMWGVTEHLNPNYKTKLNIEHLKYPRFREFGLKF